LVRSNDPKRDALQMIVTQWRNHLGVDSKYTIQDVISKAMYVADFNTALLGVASNMTGHAVSNDRLGRWLRKVQGKVVDGLKFSCDGMKELSIVEADKAGLIAGSGLSGLRELFHHHYRNCHFHQLTVSTRWNKEANKSTKATWKWS
jgi:hypothetical protein